MKITLNVVFHLTFFLSFFLFCNNYEALSGSLIHHLEYYLHRVMTINESNMDRETAS